MLRVVAVALVASVACSSPQLRVIDGPILEPATPADGYTTWTPDPLGQVIFISSSQGDDENDGRSAETPFRTIARGVTDLRDGSGDWMVLRRDDVFEEPLGTWTKSGRSGANPILIGAYGSGEHRPRLETGAAAALVVEAGASVHHLVLVGLTLSANARDPRTAAAVQDVQPAIVWLGTGGGLTIEDCTIRYYTTALHAAGPGLSSVVARRSSVVRTWAPDSVFPQGNGIFAENVTGLTVEEVLFDHVGWDERVAGGQRNLAGHALNVKESCRDVVLRDNVIVDSSSHGVLAVPADLEASGNVLSGNAIAFAVGGRVEVSDNLVLDGTDIGDAPRAGGIAFTGEVEGSVHDNLVARAHTVLDTTLSIEQRATVQYANNVVFDWADDPLNQSGPFADPSRSLASFDASVGGPGTLEHLVGALEAQSRARYDPALSTAAIRAHVWEGFRSP